MSCKIAPQLMAVKLIIVEDGLTYMVYRSLPFSGFVSLFHHSVLVDLNVSMMMH